MMENKRNKIRKKKGVVKVARSIYLSPAAAEIVDGWGRGKSKRIEALVMENQGRDK